MNIHALILGVAASSFALGAHAAQLTCFTDHVAVRIGTTISVHAHPTDTALEAAITWQATSGTFEGSGQTAAWRLTEAGVAIATATLTSETERATCTIRLDVVQPTLSSAQIRKYFLVGDEPVPVGFSTYSYLLLGEKIDPDAHENRKLVIAAFLRMIEELAQSDSRSRDGIRNLTMVPVLSAPPQIVLDDPSNEDAWEWIVANFHYKRAQDLLKPFGEHGVGPFIVSSRQEPPGVLLQDLTAAHAGVAEQWVRLHVFLTTQERDWRGTEFREYAVTTANALSVFAEAVPEAIQGVSSAVTWVVQLRALSQ